jgi:hypothetical protein
MPNYSEGKIYCLYETTTRKIFYVGSTTKSLEKRQYQHWYKSHAKNGKKLKVNHFIQNLGPPRDSFYIELFENFPCKTKVEVIKEMKDKGFELQNTNEQKDWRKDEMIRMKAQEDATESFKKLTMKEMLQKLIEESSINNAKLKQELIDLIEKT